MLAASGSAETGGEASKPAMITKLASASAQNFGVALDPYPILLEKL